MAVTAAEKRKRNAVYQARWRSKRAALLRGHSELVERELMRAVERCECGELSDQERVALANELTDIAMRHLWRSHELAELARKVRAGGGG